MAARDGLLAFVKWFVVPAALGATGFYFLGPKLGEKSTPKTEQVTATTSAEPDAAETPTSTIAAFPSPSVNIDARPMNASATNSQKPPKRHRRKKPAPTPSASPSDAPPADTNPPDNVPPPNGKADGDGV